MTVTADDVERARTGLVAAAQILLRYATTELEVEWKDGWSPVTAADREVDSLLRSHLPQPGDGWLSEESVDDGTRLDRRRVWVVDPLDGTRGFVAGRHDYSVSIALLVDGVPALGAIGNPPSGAMVIGGPDVPLEVTSLPRVPWPAADDRLRVVVSRSEWKAGDWSHLAQRCHLQPVGSVAWKLALVAAGAADATWTLQPKHEWDVAAGTALVAASGGDVWLPRGGHLRWNRRRPRFLSFGAAAAGVLPRAQALLPSAR
jgi:myo-inositol-1(or 4)-monophosphatase